MKVSSAKKLNYFIWNPNTMEESAKVLLDVIVQLNLGKVERKLSELSNCNNDK